MFFKRGAKHIYSLGNRRSLLMNLIFLGATAIMFYLSLFLGFKQLFLRSLQAWMSIFIWLGWKCWSFELLLCTWRGESLFSKAKLLDIGSVSSCFILCCYDLYFHSYALWFVFKGDHLAWLPTSSEVASKN